MLLPVEDEHAPGLVDVGGRSEQAGVLADLGLAAARHQDDLDLGAQAGLDRPDPEQGDAAVAVVEQRGPPTEERPVEVEVDAAGDHASPTMPSGAPATRDRRPIAA